jgi:hypothetical protein
MSYLDNNKLFEQMAYVPPPPPPRHPNTLTQNLTACTPALSGIYFPWKVGEIPGNQDKWVCEYCKRHNVSVFENCIGCGSSFRVKKIKHIDISNVSIKEAEKVIKKWEKILK